MTKFFGREPATIVALVEGIIALLVTLNVGLDHAHAALLVAVVTAIGGAVTGWATVDTRLGVVIGLAKSVLALAVGYGLHVSDGTQAALLALIPLVLGAWQRTQTSPSPKILGKAAASVRGS